MGQLRHQCRRLQPEQPQELRLEILIAKALPGKMNKIERRIATVGRTLKHSGLVPLGITPREPQYTGSLLNR